MKNEEDWIRMFCALLATTFFLLLLPLTVKAENPDSYHWYCVHVKDHVQPRADQNLAFVEELNGFYVDHRHESMEDDDKVIYLTFDAGYENGNVAKVLDTLREESVPGAFFILGNLIRHDPDLVRRMVEEGHTVGNHTVHHRDMSRASDEELMEELQALEKSFSELTGKDLAPYYRPPEGTFSKRNLECAKQNGYQTVFWSFAYPDWDNNRQMSPEKAKQIILENVHNGEVMLLHPTSAVNAAILGDVIRELKGQGFRFGRLEELTGSESGKV